MSDERTATHPAPPVHFEHYCEHPGCNKWGGLGFGKGNQTMRWWCGEHYPYWNRSAEAPQPA